MTPSPAPGPHAAEQALLAQLGGWRGIFDSGFPVLVFVVVNAVAGLSPAIWASVGAGALVLLIRLLRRQSPQQAIGGFVVVAIAAFVASRLHKAEGFYLPGLFINAAYILGFGGSILIRWPLIGVVWGYFEGSGTRWRSDPVRRRAYTGATLLWTAMYAIRLGVAVPLYLRGSAGGLGVASIVLGYPLTALVVLGTIWLIRRAHARTADPAPAVEELAVDESTVEEPGTDTDLPAAPADRGSTAGQPAP